MARSGTVSNPTPYEFFGTFAGLSFWPGGLTILASAPGIGKTSWLLRILAEASAAGVPAAIGCYEHTVEELKFRMRLQTEALLAGAHKRIEDIRVENRLAQVSEAVLLSLSRQEDTVRSLEETLLLDYGFPKYGNAVVAVDYLSRVPVVGLMGQVLSEYERVGEATVALHEMARRHGWALAVAAAIKMGKFKNSEEDLGALVGNENVPYEADRVLMMRRAGAVQACGCVKISVSTWKDRTGPIRDYDMEFWGARFFPALPGEEHGASIA